MDEYLLMNNGTIVENAHCIVADRNLFVYITGEADLIEMMKLFSVPDNTETIKEVRFGEEQTYSGYTYLYSMSREYGNINLVMIKEA